MKPVDARAHVDSPRAVNAVFRNVRLDTDDNSMTAYHKLLQIGCRTFTLNISVVWTISGPSDHAVVICEI